MPWWRPQEALDNVDEIAATRGLDGMFVGPNDLTISLSNGHAHRQLPHEQSQKAIAQGVAAATKKHGLLAGVFGGSAEVIKTYSAAATFRGGGRTKFDLLERRCSDADA